MGKLQWFKSENELTPKERSQVRQVRTQRIWLMLLIISVSSAILGVISYGLLMNMSINVVSGHQQRVADGLKTDMDAYLCDSQKRLSSLAQRVQALLRLSQSQADVARLLASVQSMEGGFYRVSLLYADSDRSFSFPIKRSLTAEQMQAFVNDAGVAGQPPLNSMVSTANGKRLWRYTAELKDSDGWVLGYLLLDLDYESIQLLPGMQSAALAQWFVSDDQGRVLHASPGVTFDDVPLANVAQQLADEHQTERSGLTLMVGEDEYRLLLMKTQLGLWIGVMVDMGPLRWSLRSTCLVLTLAFASLFIFLSWLGYSVLRRGLLVPLAAWSNYTGRILAGEKASAPNISSHPLLAALTDNLARLSEQARGASRSVAKMAYVDQLTHLPNRSALKDVLTKMLASSKRQQNGLAVLFIDLDDFKKVNDRLGHDAGDLLLVEVAARLQQALRGSDMLIEIEQEKTYQHLVSRLGGDEFNVILQGVTNVRDVAMVAERLITDISVPIDIKGIPVVVGASIGIALYPDDAADSETLLKRADMAMYKAKEQGKNKFCLYTESINEEVHKRLEMEQAIAEALQNNEFELYYQPKVDLRTMGISGFEALIRWRRASDQTMVPPAEFVPLSEMSPLIYAVGNWIMAEAMHQVKQWDHHLPKHLRVAINVSPRQLGEENFAEYFISLAQQFGVPLSRLEVEITETSILVEESLVFSHLQTLRDAGVRVSLDDFGTGYSSLTFLHSLPIDKVKIDRSFVESINSDNDTSTIALSVLDLCRQLGLKTIAEGIEDADQMVTLLNHGCDEGQGYLFAEPMPADQVLGYLHANQLLDIKPAGSAE